MAATLSGSSSFRRLPALPSQEMPKGLAEPPTRQSSKQPTVNRYRNDPYRIAAVMPQPPPAAPQPGPQPPMDGHGPTRPHIHIPLPAPAPDCGDKIVAGPRRGRPLPNRNTALPHLNNQPHLQPGSGNPSQPSSHRGSRQNSVTRASVAAPPPTVPVAPAAGPAGAVAPRPSAGTSGTAAEEAAVAPAGNAARGASKIALIQFKRTMMSALYDAVAFADLGVGDAVIVEGDRGEHIATIARVNVRKSKSTPTMIVRRATAADHQQHMRVKEDEAIALQTCRSHAERLGLNDVMTIVDVEFQLDFQKLTVFFQARDPSSFVDFRSLQRALYQHFRCRIWIVDC